MIEEWNIGEVERLLDWCGEQGFVFAAQSAQMEKMPNLALLRNAKYHALVDKIIERRRSGAQPINGTPRTIETLTEPSFIRTKKLSLEIFQREVRR